MSLDVKWDKRFLDVAELVSSWSKDPSTKIGAVLVDGDKRVVGMGFNGFPMGVDDSPDRYNDRKTKYAMVVHAEVNAIISAGRLARGASLYVTPTICCPNICGECCKVAIQAGVREVVFHHKDELNERWAESAAISKTMLTEAGIIYRGVK